MPPPSTSCIACLAVLGRQPHHKPLYLKVFGSRDPLTFHSYVHSSIDIIEEKLEALRTTPAPFDKYLGVLCLIDEYKAYGYITTSDVKFIVITEDVSIRETDIKSLFRWFHGLYVDVLMNPFTVVNEPIVSSRFSSEIDKVIGSFESILKTRTDNASSP